MISFNWLFAQSALEYLRTHFKYLPPASEGWREVIFSLCVSVPPWGGGAGQVPPIQVRSQEGGMVDTPIPSKVPLPPQSRSDPRMGGRAGTPAPPSRSDPRIGGGYPPPPHPGQIPGWGQGQGRSTPHPGQIPGRGGGGTPYWNSIACACYTAGGMPLAFTQEDFLVINAINNLY